MQLTFKEIASIIRWRLNDWSFVTHDGLEGRFES
jgi:hypothetical protein